ncbi:YbaN family protein [Desulfolithobacter sp.]
MTGVVSLGLGALGIVLPLLPTVPFVLLAAACFAKSSSRIHAWLCSSHLFGPMISQWQASRSIPKKSKTLALAAIGCSGATSIYLLNSSSLRILIIAILFIPVCIILNLPTSPPREDKVNSSRT